MRVTIKSVGERGIKIRFPTILICNPVTAIIIILFVKKHIPSRIRKMITFPCLCKIFREINRAKRRFPKMNLLEIEDSDGDQIIICL